MKIKTNVKAGGVIIGGGTQPEGPGSRPGRPYTHGKEDASVKVKTSVKAGGVIIGSGNQPEGAGSRPRTPRA